MNLLHADDITFRTGAVAMTMQPIALHSEKMALYADKKATVKLYERLVKWGWFEGLGRQRNWDYWQRQAPVYFDKEKL